MLASRVGCPLRLKTPNMGNTGQEDRVPVTRIITYGDESGLDEKAEYFLMGGFVGTPLDWKTVRSEWQQVLRQFGVPEFHSADFFGGKGQYRYWEGSHRDSLLDSLLSVLGNSRVIPLGCAIRIRDFLELTSKERRVLSGAYIKSRLTLRRRDTSQPFETGIGRKLEGPDAEKQVYRVGFKYFLGAVVSKVPPGCSIEVFLDKTEEFAPGAFEYFKERRQGYKYPDGQTLQSLDFVDSAKEPAIQAADLYAHVAARQLNGHQKDPRRQRVWKALCEENTPHLMDYQSFRQQLDPIEQWDRQFNIDWGFPPDHESAF